MRLRDLGRNSWFLIWHAFRQKVRGPLATRAWERKRRPFLYTGARKIRFRLHPGQYIDNRIFFDGAYERRFLEFLSRRLRRGGAMLDVGANIGNHALYLSRHFDEIHCFEPNPAAVARLNDNLSLNPAAGVHVHSVGLGAEAGELPFQEDPENLAVSRFVAAADDNSILLRIAAGDQVVEDGNISDVNYIKVDVEGFEAQVLKGLRRTIERFRPVVTFEYLGESSPDGTFESIRSSLRGYRLFEPLLDPRETGLFSKILFYLSSACAPTLVEITDPEPRYYPYIIALPPARLAEFDIR